MTRTILAVLLAVALVACDGDSQPAPPASPAASGYPLDVCVVSGEKLGSMGDPIVLKQDGTEVRLCCEGCVDSFKKDPAKHLAKLKAAH